MNSEFVGDKEEPFQRKRIVVQEAELLAKLTAPDYKENVFILESLPSVGTLNSIAQTLKYEVQILVSNDLQSTAFIPGEAREALSNTKIRQLKLENFASSTHNHPNSDSTPSLKDLVGFNRTDATYVVIAAEGVCEYRADVKGSKESLYQFLIQDKITPWLDVLKTDPSFFRKKAEETWDNNLYYLRLDEADQAQTIADSEEAEMFNAFLKFYSESERSVWAPLMRRYLLNSNRPLAKFFSWDEEEAINQLLRGKTQFK